MVLCKILDTNTFVNNAHFKTPAILKGAEYKDITEHHRPGSVTLLDPVVEGAVYVEGVKRAYVGNGMFYRNVHGSFL